MIKVKLFQSMAPFIALICIFFASTVSAQSDTEPSQVLNETEAINEAETEKQLSGFDRQLVAELDAQQKRLLLALEQEDAFSLKLSEAYGEYGALLLESGRIDEANDVYTQALHIQKVNHGIYSVEQLYFLKKLFQTAVELDDTELVDRYLNKANTIEKKNENLVSEHVGEMYVRAGHFYLDQYYQQSRRYKVKLSLLREARSYFERTLTRFQDNAITKETLPYGELLLVGYLENALLREMPLIFDGSTERFNVSAITASSNDVRELERDYWYVKGAYRRSFRSFNDYVRKARADGDLQEEVNAMLFWADTLILFKRNREATKYYKLAWEKSQEINPSEQLDGRFNQPQRIPAYHYLIERESDADTQQSIQVPITFSVAKDGSVSNIQMIDSSDDHQKYFASARNEASDLSFRPAIIDGDTAAVEEFSYEVKVRAN